MNIFSNKIKMHYVVGQHKNKVFLKCILKCNILLNNCYAFKPVNWFLLTLVWPKQNGVYEKTIERVV